MKKIHDIKPRAKKVRESKEHLSWSESFWHGHKTKVAAKKTITISSLGRKVVISIFILALLMIASGRAYVVKADLVSDAELAKQHLNRSLSLLKDGEYDKALDESVKAKTQVEKIKINLQAWGQDSQYMKMIDYRSDIVGAENLITAIDQVLDIAVSTKDIIEQISSQLSDQKMVDASNIDFKINLALLEQHLDNKIAQVEQINLSMKRNKTSSNLISMEEQRQITDSFAVIGTNIAQIKESYLPVLKWFLGVGAERKIMILLQNNAELRGSGGFIGSYAIATAENSALKRIDFQTNIYKLDKAAADKIDVEAPAEYDVLSGGKLYLRDANYAVDGPESLAKVMNLYQLESGQSLDGIIAIDTSLIISLLKITGPVDFPDLGLSVTAENFLTEVQTEVEKNYFTREGALTENEPKKILAEMMPIIMNRTFAKIKDKSSRAEVLGLLKDSLSSKNILMYSKETDIQTSLERFNLAGKLATGSFDYFMSHSTNILGGKSSLNMAEDVRDELVIDESGEISHNITITRQHQGSGAWPDSANINLVRIMMPDGSEVRDFKTITGNFWPHMDKARSKEPDHYSGEEANRDKLSFWMNTPPQESTQVSFSYRTSYKIDTTAAEKVYRLYLQKQPGSNANNYHFSIKYPKSWNFVANYVHRDLQYDFILDKDKILELKFR